jgi:hypothetical protein
MILSALAVLAAAPGGAQPRTDVHLFRYAGVQGAEMAAAFDEFQYALHDQLKGLAQSLADVAPGAGALKLERIVDAGGGGLADPLEWIPSFEQEKSYWRDAGALALLTGRVSRRRGDGLAILSRLFWGDIGADSAGMSIDIALPLAGAYYDASKDSHAAAILFAYAMHLPAECAREPERFALLSAAQQRARAVAGDDAALGNALLARITRTLEALERTPCGR